MALGVETIGNGLTEAQAVSQFKSSLTHPNYAQAVAVVKSRVAQGSTKGGHLMETELILVPCFIHIEG